MKTSHPDGTGGDGGRRAIFIVASLRLAVIVASLILTVQTFLVASSGPSTTHVGIRAEPVGWGRSVIDGETSVEAPGFEVRQCPVSHRVRLVNELVHECGALVVTDAGPLKYISVASKRFEGVPKSSDMFGRCERPLHSAFTNLVAVAEPTDWCAYLDTDGNWTIAGVDGQFFRLSPGLNRIDATTAWERIGEKFQARPWTFLIAMALISCAIWLVFRRRGGVWSATLGVGLTIAAYPAMASIWASFIWANAS